MFEYRVQVPPEDGIWGVKTNRAPKAMPTEALEPIEAQKFFGEKAALTVLREGHSPRRKRTRAFSNQPQTGWGWGRVGRASFGLPDEPGSPGIRVFATSISPCGLVSQSQQLGGFLQA